MGLLSSSKSSSSSLSVGTDFAPDTEIDAVDSIVIENDVTFSGVTGRSAAAQAGAIALGDSENSVAIIGGERSLFTGTFGDTMADFSVDESVSVGGNLHINNSVNNVDPGVLDFAANLLSSFNAGVAANSASLAAFSDSVYSQPAPVVNVSVNPADVLVQSPVATPGAGSVPTDEPEAVNGVGTKTIILAAVGVLFFTLKK